MTREILTSARLADGSAVDVGIDGGVIVSIDPAGAGLARGVDATTTNLGGWLLLPAPVEPHAHLDKAFLAETVPNPTGDLMGAIDAMSRAAPHRSVAETAHRAERAARMMATNGYVAVRSHLDLTLGDGLRNVEALIEVRARLADVIDIELVGLVGMGFSGAERDELSGRLATALDMGVDLVGGCPHLEADSQAATDILLQIASDHGVGVDLHTDETLDPTARSLDQLIAAVEAGFAHPVTASHCVALGQRPSGEQRQVAERAAAAGVGVVVLPQTNLFLQGRGVNPAPRGLTAVQPLLDAGVSVCAGADNLQDPFNPIGRACPFEIAALMMICSYTSADTSWGLVSDNAAAVLGRRSGIEVGAPANLIAVDATTIREAIATGPQRQRWFTPGSKIAPG